MVDQVNSIPETIDGSEVILRGLYTPMHYDPKKGKVLSNAFSPRPNELGVSVIRLQYAGIELCKYHMKRFASESRKYVGFARIYGQTVHEASSGSARAEIKARPAEYDTHSLEAHSEIYYYQGDNIVPKESGVEMPADVRFIIHSFCKAATPPFIDSQPDQEEWGGLEIC